MSVESVGEDCAFFKYFVERFQNYVPVSGRSVLFQSSFYLLEPVAYVVFCDIQAAYYSCCLCNTSLAVASRFFEGGKHYSRFAFAKSREAESTCHSVVRV